MRTLLGILIGGTVATITALAYRRWWQGMLHWLFSRGDQ